MESESPIYSELSRIADNELERVKEKHGPFNSRYEAIAMILADLQKADEGLKFAHAMLACFWKCVRKGEDHDAEPTAIVRSALTAAAELVQVAAMARKFIKEEQGIE